MSKGKLAVCILSILAVAGLAPDAHAQGGLKSSIVNTALARAIALHDSAVALYNQPARSADAARLHVREAQLRSPSDPEAVQALVMAANLFNYAKQPLNAKRVMEQAAERAIAIGDILAAASAYTNAAFLARNQGNRPETQRLAYKAMLLSHSPFIEPQQRTAIRDRFKTDPAFAGLAE